MNVFEEFTAIAHQVLEVGDSDLGVAVPIPDLSKL